jgi:co-chaperonin GroES (HSP10)
MKTIDVRDIVPLKTGIIIKELERETVTESGLELTETQNSGTPVVGTVVAVGEESRFKIGDTVFFRRYSVDELSFIVDGKKQTVNFITDDEVVAYAKRDEN